MGNVWGLNNSGGKSSKMGADPCVSGWMIEFIGLVSSLGRWMLAEMTVNTLPGPEVPRTC